MLNLEKSNDSPNADNGDIVTYTLQVNVPDDSGASFDTCVTDLIPEGFDYNGVWTASSSSLGHNVSNEVANSSEDCGSAGGPDYSSPGQWFIGTVLPGETVTLTYQAVIGDEVFPGIYPDVAYATGDACGPEAINCSEGGEDIYSNLHNTGDDPFVSTTVAIDGPQILGASTVTRLANTGDAYMHWYATFAAILLAAGLLIAKRFNISKGGLK